MIRARRALPASGRPAWAWALGALGGVAAGAASCTLIATFDDRPSPTTTTATTTTDSTGGGGAGGAPLGIVGAFPLERCEGTPAASPFADGECNYRDEACTGFADLAHEYVAKGTLVASEPALACDRGALAAYEPLDADGHGTGELRIVARAGTPGPCTKAAPTPGMLALLRVDPRTMSLVDTTPFSFTAAEGLPPPESAVVVGHSERRVGLAFVAVDGEGSRRLYVLTTRVDAGPAAATPVPSVWSMQVAAKPKVSSTFVPARLTLVDDVPDGAVYVAVDAALGTSPLVVQGSEQAPETLAFPGTLTFSNATATAAFAHLFARSTLKIPADAGADAAAMGVRTNPAAESRIAVDGGFTVVSNSVEPKGLDNVRYLVVPGTGSPTGLADPWYVAAQLGPENPGPWSFLAPAHVRLELFGYGGHTYAQLRGCSVDDDGPCVLSAKVDGGAKKLDAGGIAACDDATALFGVESAGGSGPRLHATCDLGAVPLGSGVVTWHRTAGGFGAALAADGDSLVVLRPGNGVDGDGGATVALARATPTSTKLAGDGPIDVTFVDGLGWVVVAVAADGATPWARRFGCALLP